MSSRRVSRAWKCPPGRPDVGCARWRWRRTAQPPGGPAPLGRIERAGPALVTRFTPSEVPVLTSCPPQHTLALREVGRALAQLGRSYLGGHVELRWDDPPPPPSAAAGTERVAAVRAVENVLHGGCGTVRFPLPSRWAEPTRHDTWTT